MTVLIEDIIKAMDDFTINSPLNVVHELNDLRIYDCPLVGVANADDPLFLRLKEPDAVGPQHMTPGEWLAQSKAIISYFLPFTAAVRTANRQPGPPALEWLYGRFEGQAFNAALSQLLVDKLTEAGYRAVAPALDSRFAITNRRSNWSERHVAFIAGLGTISRNRSLITKAGAAGRIGSVVVDLELEATQRYYTAIEENCSQCGACIRRCPPQAITETGKDHALCSDYLDKTKLLFKPRYGCGKCQTAVPCEDKIPPRRSSSI
jgi:epoxyqueuosine reductase